MTPSPEALYSIHIGIGVLTGAALALLAMMFWNASLTNRDTFTTMFLRLLAGASVARVLEIAGAMYRAAEIPADAVPQRAVVVGLAGRAVELTAYCIMIWFMLRPDTKKALNGAGSSAPG